MKIAVISQGGPRRANQVKSAFQNNGHVADIVRDYEAARAMNPDMIVAIDPGDRLRNLLDANAVPYRIIVWREFLMRVLTKELGRLLAPKS